MLGEFAFLVKATDFKSDKRAVDRPLGGSIPSLSRHITSRKRK